MKAAHPAASKPSQDAPAPAKDATLATTKEAPPTATQAPSNVSKDPDAEKLIQRAARFGIAPSLSSLEKIEEEKKAARAARFNLPAEKEKTNVNDGKVKGIIDKEQLQKRIERFGPVAPIAKKIVAQEARKEEETKKQLRKERFQLGLKASEVPEELEK